MMKTMKTMKNKMMVMKIACDTCGHNWDYHGKTQWYLACPQCKNIININELTEDSRNKVKKSIRN